MFRRRPPELGRLLAVHRPRHPLGWAILAAVPVPFPIIAALSEPGPAVGIAFLIVPGIPWLYALSGRLLLQHRIYEHGIVLRTDLPGNSYCVPFYTVDPGRITVGGRHPPDDGLREPIDRRVRRNPLIAESIRFPGLDPAIARSLATGKVSWHEARHRTITLSGTTIKIPHQERMWAVTFTDAERHRRLLLDTVAASQRTYEYYRAP